jgi:TatD DNase family protein
MQIPFVDIHTHHPVTDADIVSIPSLFLQEIDINHPLPFPFTTAIHPWHAQKYDLDEIKIMLKGLDNQNGMIAIGETGLDKKCPIDFNLQKLVFELHIDYAERNHKPLIIHCVNAWNEMITYSKHSKVPLILHGYNADIELTKQLIRHGFYFSVGKAILKENGKLQESIQLIPPTSMFFETDDEKLDIRDIYDVAAKILDYPLKDLKQQILTNYNNIFER